MRSLSHPLPPGECFVFTTTPTPSTTTTTVVAVRDNRFGGHQFANFPLYIARQPASYKKSPISVVVVL